MFDRLFGLPKDQHVFIFGPRGVGKTSWLKSNYPKAPYFDLLEAEIYFELSRKPTSLLERIGPHYRGPVIIDEVQKLPSLLDEIHRLIETKNLKITFILTASSARKLKRSGVNLLAGRAHVYHFYPLTSQEIGAEFQLKKALKLGMLLPVGLRFQGQFQAKII
ncbi:MAG: AAA family ATPase [Bacteriovoracaceae bacterium]|nr:AAA family ATPase [Bacteriovoracaceae bacterium]